MDLPIISLTVLAIVLFAVWREYFRASYGGFTFSVTADASQAFEAIDGVRGQIDALAIYAVPLTKGERRVINERHYPLTEDISLDRPL